MEKFHAQAKRNKILVIKNISREDPGLLGEIIMEQGISYDIADLSLGQKPGSVENYGAIVVLGGPDSAIDETLKMKSELTLIRKVLAEGIPYLGICLGLQTMVKAGGGQVVKSPVPEVGLRDHNGQFYTVRLTREGRNDLLFDGMEDSFRVFHLHGETVTITENMQLLATGRSCLNQIVKIGSSAYGIQGHLELTESMLGTWIREDPDLHKINKEQLLHDFKSGIDIYSQTGRQLLTNFLRIAGFL